MVLPRHVRRELVPVRERVRQGLRRAGDAARAAAVDDLEKHGERDNKTLFNTMKSV